MTEQELKTLIEMGLSQRKIAKKLDISQSTVKHYLKKFGLRTISSEKCSNIKYCPKCKTTHDKSNFYKNGSGLTSYCKNCSSRMVIERQQRFKNACLEYKGNKCVICGYDKYAGALEFHHRDSIDKEFNISAYRLYKFDDSVRKELDKCDVLCSNCHKEVHFQIRGVGGAAASAGDF